MDKKQKVMDVDFPKDQPMTKARVARIKKHRRLIRGNIRIATGRIYTDEEYETHRKEVLETPLP